MLDNIENEQKSSTSGNVSHLLTHNLDQEAEYITLPSQGLFYQSPYKGLERLKVRKLNWEDEDILTTKSYYDNGTLFTELLKNCIVDDNGFKAKDLVAIDRDAILWWLRITAFGVDYTVMKKCINEDCGKTNEITWNLGEFMMPDPNPTYLDELKANGSVLIELPISKLKCRVTIPSTGREDEIAKRLNLKKTKTKSTRDFNITGKLISIISEVYDSAGNKLTASDDITNWLRTGFNGNPIPLVDSRTIQLVAKDINIKIDTKQDVVCRHCGQQEEGLEMFMSINFFWPEYNKV
jgi:hypothetical protein